MSNLVLIYILGLLLLWLLGLTYFLVHFNSKFEELVRRYREKLLDLDSRVAYDRVPLSSWRVLLSYLNLKITRNPENLICEPIST